MTKEELDLLIYGEVNPTSPRVTTSEFVGNHTHINYCEAIIHPNGQIAYAVPSHIRYLENETGLTLDELVEILPHDESELIGLLRYTGCVAVYTKGYIHELDLTDAQQNTLNTLSEHNLIKNERLYLGW